MQNISVRTIASQLKDDFGVDMDIYAVVRACSDGLKKMGMFALSRFIIQANIKDYKVQLPTTVWKVKGAIDLAAYYPIQSGTVIFSDKIEFPPQIVFIEHETSTEMIRTPDVLKSNYVPQITGPYIDYVWENPFLRFNKSFGMVAIECTGLSLDDEGFPMLPEEAKLGCLYYALWVHYQPLFIRGQVSPQVFAEMGEWKRRNMSQSETAGMMQRLSSNERDKLANIMTSFDRKKFGNPI